MRLRKIIIAICQINIYMLKLKAEENSWYARFWEITIFCDNQVPHLLFIIQSLSLFFDNCLQRDLPFSRKSDRRRRKVWFHLPMSSIICSQTQLDNIKHEQTLICKQLFASHVMGSRPLKRKKNLRWMIITFDYKETPA